MFETGAKTHKVDSLVLFTDSTESLHKMVREVYRQHRALGDKDRDIAILMAELQSVLSEALSLYGAEIIGLYLSAPEKEDFTRLYAEEYFSYDVQQFLLTSPPIEVPISIPSTVKHGNIRPSADTDPGRKVVDEDVLSILSQATIDGNTLQLTSGELDKKLYRKVDDVLCLLGGKWHTKSRTHVFESDPTERIEAVLTYGNIELPPKLGYFPTPVLRADHVILLADIQPGMLVLEPSAGRAALARRAAAIVGKKNVHCVELQEPLRAFLEGEGYPVIGDDFMACTPARIYDRVIMNPPFEKLQDILHVSHALKFLKPQGRLVSIMSPGMTFRREPVAAEFRTLFESLGGVIEQNPEGSFKESGTNINTITIILDLPASDESPACEECVEGSSGIVVYREVPTEEMAELILF